MHYAEDVHARLAVVGDSIAQRFALDCAMRSVNVAEARGRAPSDYADVLRAKLALKRSHVLRGEPDR